MARTRKAPQMTGIFADLANEFLDYKRNAGFKYENEAKCLARLCRFSTDQGIDCVEITRTLAEAWAAPKEQESDKTRAHKITCIRQFAMFLDNLGYDAYILPEQKGLHYDSFTPYIFTLTLFKVTSSVAIISLQHSYKQFNFLHSRISLTRHKIPPTPRQRPKPPPLKK